MADSPEEIKKAVKLYTFMGLVLFVCTGLTVAVATQESLDFGGHGFDYVDMLVGLAIATFKASCVGYIFMHLNHEKKSIYWIFFGSFVFCFFLFFLFYFAKYDPIHFDGFMDGSVK
jgi:caa(3)-type oxidase subunit IV